MRSYGEVKKVGKKGTWIKKMQDMCMYCKGKM